MFGRTPGGFGVVLTDGRENRVELAAGESAAEEPEDSTEKRGCEAMASNARYA
jgi:hypothetical protein